MALFASSLILTCGKLCYILLEIWNEHLIYLGQQNGMSMLVYAFSDEQSLHGGEGQNRRNHQEDNCSRAFHELMVTVQEQRITLYFLRY